MVSHGPRSHGRGLLVRYILLLVFLNNYKQTAGLQDGAVVFRLFMAFHNTVYILSCVHAQMRLSKCVYACVQACSKERPSSF
jgi:hypothetical protein